MKLANIPQPVAPAISVAVSSAADEALWRVNVKNSAVAAVYLLSMY
ncbi:hypothetical protein Q4591_04815 [Shewanella sp. 3_MG-2023]|nr:hypothetical protein [Shewanella sp. 3_MG-2023]MDO6774669.1 hypothetical protein [Shewanella sp. 3_MG-2023]